MYCAYLHQFPSLALHCKAHFFRLCYSSSRWSTAKGWVSASTIGLMKRKHKKKGYSRVSRASRFVSNAHMSKVLFCRPSRPCLV
jgi:hypothetical protein